MTPSPAVVVLAVDDLRAIVREAVREALVPSATVTQHDAVGMGFASPRAFLEAARRGAFPVTRAGRTVRALRADVERYLARPAHAPANDATPTPAAVRALLAGRAR